MNSTSKLIFTFLLLTLTISLRLKVKSPLTLQKNYQLECEGAEGSVEYHADNLPKGVRINGDKLEVSNSAEVKEGYYTIKLHARDSRYNSD